ncbi:20076_t:CDS:2 [Rhizophagus irregularis]|nr:20076_t:CDS:2 [Rhizophagus irregularis]
MGPCFGLKDLFVNGDTGDCKRHSYEKKIIDIERFEIEEYEIFQIIEKRLSSDNFRYTNCSLLHLKSYGNINQHELELTQNLSND